MAVRTLLFDFFGTLVAYNPSRREQGYRTTHALLGTLGAALGYDEFVDGFDSCFTGFERDTSTDHREFSMAEVTAHFLGPVLGRAATADEVDAFVETYLAEWNTGVQHLAGVPDMLDALGRRHRLGVLTNTHHPSLVPGHLAAIGIADAFDVVVTSVEHGWRKPHPSVYDATLTALGAPAADTVFVGDTYEADYAGPRAAGMAALLIDPARRHAIDERHRVHHVLDVADTLAALG